MSPDTFERIEKKYLLDRKQHRLVLSGLAGRVAPDEFGRSTVTSVYFDTAHYQMVERSLDKPLYKEKLRLRLYGNPCDAQASSPCFMEQKTKFQGVVYKRRVQLSLAAAWEFAHGRPWQDACKAHPPIGEAPALAGESPCSKEAQILEELAAMMRRHGILAPSITTACERTAWVPLDAESPLRITFDEDIRWKHLRKETHGKPRLSCSGWADAVGANEIGTDASEAAAMGADTGWLRGTNAGWLRATDEGAVLMEVKNGGPYPRWLCDLLSQAQAYPQSFSKYGTAYCQLKRGPHVPFDVLRSA